MINKNRHMHIFTAITTIKTNFNYINIKKEEFIVL